MTAEKRLREILLAAEALHAPRQFERDGQIRADACNRCGSFDLGWQPSSYGVEDLIETHDECRDCEGHPLTAEAICGSYFCRCCGARPSVLALREIPTGGGR